MKFEPERKQFSIVLIGNFNAALFEPEWFFRNGIISQEDVDLARDENSVFPIVVTSQLTLFKTSQFTIKIEQNKFSVISETESFSLIRDFVVNTFAVLGGYTIKAFGFNYSAHYNVGDMDTYQMIGDNLAPKKYWVSFLEDEVTGIDRKSGLADIQMIKYKEDNIGYIKIQLQPSNFIRPGVFITCNDHYQIDEKDSNADNVITMISEAFEPRYEYMKNMHINLLNEVVNTHE